MFDTFSADACKDVYYIGLTHSAKTALHKHYTYDMTRTLYKTLWTSVCQMFVLPRYAMSAVRIRPGSNTSSLDCCSRPWGFDFLYAYISREL